LAGSHALKNLRQRLKEVPFLLSWLTWRLRCAVRQNLDELGEQSGEISASEPKRCSERSGEWRGEDIPQEIKQWSEGQDAVGLEAAPLKHGEPLVDGAYLSFADEARFADASLAGNQHDLPTTLACLGNQAL
jgi:hypothetical protein